MIRIVPLITREYIWLFFSLYASLNNLHHIWNTQFNIKTKKASREHDNRDFFSIDFIWFGKKKHSFPDYFEQNIRLICVWVGECVCVCLLSHAGKCICGYQNRNRFWIGIDFSTPCTIYNNEYKKKELYRVLSRKATQKQRG